MEGDGVSGTVAEPVRVPLDEERRGGGQRTQEGSEKRQEQGNSLSHGIRLGRGRRIGKDRTEGI